MRFRDIVVAIGVVASLNATAASYKGLEYSTEGDIVPGKWTSQFAKAKAYADEKNVPMVLLWGNNGCGYCDTLISALAGSEAVAWAKARGYVFVFGHSNTDEGSKVRSFINMSGGFPFCRAVWKASTSATGGYEVSYKFHGRKGQMQCPWSNSLAQQFMDSVDYYVGGYAGAYALDITVDPTIAGTAKGSGIYVAGETVEMSASAKSAYVFSGWYQGTSRLSQHSSHSVQMSDQAMAITAKFIKKSDDYVSVACELSGVYARGEAITPIAVSVNSGSAANITFAGLPPGLSYDADDGTVVGTPTKSGIYSVSLTAKTQGGVSQTLDRRMVVKADNEFFLDLTGLSGAGSLSGGGIYAVGANASLKAKAVSGWAFSGWYEDDELVSRSAKYVYSMPDHDVTLEGKFVTKSDDAASIDLSVDGWQLSTATSVVITNYAGVSAKLPVVATALTTTQVKASGLPSGLKLVTDKSTGEVSITGVASKAPKADSKLTVTTGAGNKVTFVLSMVVIPLPSWAYGTFNGGSDNGSLSLTIAKTGKASGKWLSNGLTWSLSAASFAGYEIDDAAYALELIGKNGKNFQTNHCTVSEFVVGDASIGGVEGGDFTAAQNLWKTSPWKELSATMAKAPQLSYELGSPTGVVTLKFGKTGAVTASGVFGTYKASCSATLIVAGENQFKVCVYFPPKTGKFAGYCGIINLNWDGAEFSLDLP